MGVHDLILSKTAFESTLDIELKRGVRYPSFVSLLLLEADFVGHEGESQPVSNDGPFMAKIASLIRQDLRETDIIGAPDGRIVPIILLSSDGLTAQRVGSRIIAWISNYLGADSQASGVQFRLGRACFPSDATDVQCLYQSASTMLTEAARLKG